MNIKKYFVLSLFITLVIVVGVYLLSISDYRDILHSNETKNIYKTEVDSSARIDIKNNLDTIVKWSNRYQVSPKAIIGIIIAERSLHKGPVNYFEEYYVKTFFLNKPESYLKALVQATKQKIENRKLNGESEKEFAYRLKHGLIWTIGLCQISIMKSLEVDSLMAISEKRTSRTIKQNIEALLTPNYNLEYCAFILNNIQTKFKQGTGLDISNNIGVLCTLYNTGKILESIDKYNRTKTAPQPNNFGKFVDFKSKILDDILNK